MTLRDRLVPVIERHLERSKGCNSHSVEPRSHEYALFIAMAAHEGGSMFGVWDPKAEQGKLYLFQEAARALLKHYLSLSPPVRNTLTDEVKRAWDERYLPYNPVKHGVYYVLRLLGEQSDLAIENTIESAKQGEDPGRQNWRAAAILDMCRDVWFWNFKKQAPRWINADTTRKSRGKFASFADDVLRECGETVSARSAARVLIENVSSYRPKTDETG